ncbi:hypothetical protein [Hymenobacter jeollabukensis]|uniref:Uncharacterized protein n=1 Tax=Hymenobacter jeollabukensis TaxID=2025313 RepID=A0A5R8WSD0_9BACT|nr:hypothetical protein [Hymenobacter jeollabukensis]TLM94091.1 hypothetical protein FDY95_08685 [Hymenobacter jeollabukensis]
MGKKHKKSKKQDSVSDSLLDATALSIKKYRKVTDEIAKLSPLQKLVGGLAVVAAGYYYLKNLQHSDDWRDSPVAGLLPLPWRPAPRHQATYREADIEDADAEPVPPPRPHKAHKAHKPEKHAHDFGKKAASPDDE